MGRLRSTQLGSITWTKFAGQPLAAVVDALYLEAGDPLPLPAEFWAKFSADSEDLQIASKFGPFSLAGRLPDGTLDVVPAMRAERERQPIFRAAVTPLIEALAQGDLDLRGVREPFTEWRTDEAIPRMALAQRAWVLERRHSRLQLLANGFPTVEAYRHVKLVVAGRVTSQEAYAQLVAHLRALAQSSPELPTHGKAELWEAIRVHPRWRGAITWDAYMAARAEAFAGFPQWTRRGVRRRRDETAE